MPVVACFRVMPQGVETDIDLIEEGIRKALREAVKDIKKEEIAFGLVALQVLVMIADAEGGTDGVEQALSGIGGVQSVSVVDVSLI